MFNFLIFFTTITILASLMVMAGLALSKKLTLDYEKSSPFECGFTPKFNARLPFTLRFFLIAIIFLVFDVELILMFPFLANMLMATSVVANYIMYFLLVILMLGLSHEWNQGSLEWAA
uniref:NADH dehydrogenase subunit 3 n=1 Tax=Calanus simillimus TaxID=148988 RepID=UPI002027EB53|nr:NADH dehydrogenase subunit 3 [Calanus simillimus]UPP55810.1 NADH dehydrogenase subunit 3 [Calanus simillimus]